MRKIIIALILIASIILPACTPQGQGTTLTIGWTNEPDSLNPGLGLSQEAYVIYNLVYDSMYQYNPDGTYTPELAESVTVSPDGTVWIFKIREGAKFHDGTSLSADDVAFTYNYYASHPDEFPYMPAYTTFFKSVETAPENTVVITLTAPLPNMESQLYYMYILPKRIWESIEGQAAAEFANEEMLGSGPFKLEEFKTGEYVKLTANKDHFLYHPQMDTVIFKVYPSQTEMVEALELGEVDMITDVPLASAADLSAAAGIKLVSGRPVAPRVSDILINQVTPENCPKDAGGICSGHPALRDLKVRQALATAVDKNRIIKEVMYGLAEPGLTLIPTGLGKFYNNTLVDYRYNPGEANAILDGAGYLDTNGDGIREMPDGSISLKFRLEWDESSEQNGKTASLLEEMWKAIGIELTLMPIPVDSLYGNCCPAFDYDIQLSEWGSDPDPNFLLSIPLSSQVSTGLNEVGYANSEYDKLYDQQAIEFNPETRRKLIWEMQRIMLEDVTYIAPYYPTNVQAYREDNFTGWIVNQPTLSLQDMTNIVNLEPVKK